jgi:ABC-type multidrug transport system fused ATPase/permease subunit
MVDWLTTRLSHVLVVTQKMLLLPQEPVIFSCSVAENIAFGTQLAKAQLEHISILLNLHADVLKLPDGYDTLLSAPGAASLLTDAMKRRIGLARVLARDSPILLLDDPVAGLDSNSKQEIFRALEGVMSGRTVCGAHEQSRMNRREGRGDARACQRQREPSRASLAI